MTDSGGTIAAEIAIPTTRSDKFGRTCAYVPTNPLKSAIKKYRKSGFVLLKISGVKVNVSLYIRVARYPMSADIASASRLPNIIDVRDSNIPFTRNNIRFSENPKKGDIRGATTIPPMIIAGSLSMRPAAIIGA